jgi:hypothetical protein
MAYVKRGMVHDYPRSLKERAQCTYEISWGAMTVSPAAVSPEMAKLLDSQGIAIAVKKTSGATYLFTVWMEAIPAKGNFQVAGLSGDKTVHVIGEDRAIPMHDGQFEDNFAAHAVHLYRIQA